MIAFPAYLGCVVEVEELDAVGFGVDREIPRVDVAVVDTVTEVEVVDSLCGFVRVRRRKRHQGLILTSISCFKYLSLKTRLLLSSSVPPGM